MKRRSGAPSSRHTASRLVIAVLVVVGLGACGTSRSVPAGATRVTVRNFAIDAPTTLKAGAIQLAITGAGPTMHELNVAETADQASGLPLAADGTVDDKADRSGFHHVAEAEGIDIGDTKVLAMTLEPGHYVLYCNMPGHYGIGMATELTVTA